MSKECLKCGGEREKYAVWPDLLGIIYGMKPVMTAMEREGRNNSPSRCFAIRRRGFGGST